MAEVFYYAVFGAFGFVAALLMWKQGIAGKGDSNAAFTSFRNNYLIVYSLQMLGDWMQGPYVYALYESYGYKPQAIGQLFIAGFGSSLLFGTIAGALADKAGRRNAGLAYVVTYSLSCVTKHSPNFYVLMLGRVLGGIATSLLFSAFESWLVCEHFKRGFSEQSLGDTFSWAVFLGNGLMAIFAGFLGNFLVDDLGLGRVAPFDAAIVAMLAGGVLMAATWPENHGDQAGRGVRQQFGKAWAAISTDPCIALLGAMQSMFEAAMYSFVFLWTMALSPNGEAIKHGLIFVNFMTASMVGSFTAGILMKRARPESYMKAVYAVGAVAMLLPAVISLTPKDAALSGQPITRAGMAQMLAMCVFEVCVGVFWPSMMKMRSAYVPEELRSTIINCFRVPLNLFVCIVLANVDQFPLWLMFSLCAALLAASCACQVKLDALASARGSVYHKLHPAGGGDDGEMHNGGGGDQAVGKSRDAGGSALELQL